MNIVSIYFLFALGVGVACFLVTAAVATWIHARDQQRKDLAWYGRHSSLWQIALEIWKIREIR